MFSSSFAVFPVPAHKKAKQMFKMKIKHAYTEITTMNYPLIAFGGFYKGLIIHCNLLKFINAFWVQTPRQLCSEVSV